MVGSCGNCQRPWYAADGSLPPLACRGCGGSIREDVPDTPSRGAGAADSHGAPPDSFESEFDRIHGQIESEAEHRAAANFSSGVLIAGLVTILGAGAWAFETWQFQQTALSVTGVVTGVEHWQSKRTTKEIYSVDYQAGGKRHTIRSSYGSGDRGTVVPLLVSRTDSTDAREAAGLWINKIAIGTIGLICVGASFLLRPKRPARSELLSDPVESTARSFE